MATPKPSRTTRSHGRRRPSAVLMATALAAATSMGLAACSVTNPITTSFDYDGSDGVAAALGDLRLGNLIVLTEAEGAPGTLVGQVTNQGAASATVAFGVAGVQLGQPLDVGTGQTVIVGPDRDRSVDLDAVPVPPGAFLEVTVAVDTAGTTTVQVPVLDGTFPEYTDLVPSADG